MSYTQQSVCLKLDCNQQLPGRFEHVRGGRFHYDESDYGYTHEMYNVRVVPHLLNDGCLWKMFIVGSVEEPLWCRTYYCCPPCSGWLANKGGDSTDQQWYYGNDAVRIPMRFIDGGVASMIQAVDATVASDKLANLIGKLTQSFADLRDETRQRAQQNLNNEAAMFRALSQRHETDMQDMFEKSTNIARERCEQWEKHSREAMEIERTTFESQIKQSQREASTSTNVFWVRWTSGRGHTRNLVVAIFFQHLLRYPKLKHDTVSIRGMQNRRPSLLSSRSLISAILTPLIALDKYERNCERIPVFD